VITLRAAVLAEWRDILEQNESLRRDAEAGEDHEETGVAVPVTSDPGPGIHPSVPERQVEGLVQQLTRHAVPTALRAPARRNLRSGTTPLCKAALASGVPGVTSSLSGSRRRVRAA
jgi:hypothetical protein